MAEDKHDDISNHIDKGTLIYRQGDPVNEFCIVLKGRVLIQNHSIRSAVGTGSFLGVYDLFKGEYQVSYIALDNLVVLRISVKSSDDILAICEKNSGYGGLLAIYLGRRIKSLYSMYNHLREEVISLREFIDEKYNIYKVYCNDNKLDVDDLYVMRTFSEINTMHLSYHEELDYYVACTEVPLDVQKHFFSYNKAIYMHHIEEQQELIANLYYECSILSEEVKKNAKVLVLDNSCLYNCVVKIAILLKQIGRDDSYWMSEIDLVIDKINEIEELCSKKLGIDLGIDRNMMEQAYYALLSGGAAGEKMLQDVRTVEVLKDSLNQILLYAEFDNKKTDEYTELIKKFTAMKDKFSKEAEMMALRNAISKHFYKLYAVVFRKAIIDKKLPFAVELFLKYGFISEKLLSEEQLKELVSLKEADVITTPCAVYTLFDWLKLIYYGEKEPSKNEFDLDYAGNIRELVKSGRISKQAAINMQLDMDKKLEFEIENVFRINNRLLSEQITTFVPILFDECCNMSLTKVQLTSYKINSAIRKIIDIDYSVFSREVIFTDPKAGIVKDYIMKDVFPDIIIFPCYGNKGTMWQEITGRKRDSAGRFIFPAFLDADEYTIMVGVIGRFRWEICRTIQGLKWNDISEHSLTSEYCDYIQFFKKNKNLSEDQKEKIKQQIKNMRNNSKEVFTKDYTEWIMWESNGGIRLNKVTRDIMAMYCPFRESSRNKLSAMPLYAEAMKRFNMQTSRKLREYEGKCGHLSRAGIPVPEDLEKTRDFYKM